MQVPIFFNSNYFDTRYDSRQSAALGFSSMVKGLKDAIASGAKDYLISASNALDVEISVGYTVRNWINDRETKISSEDEKLDKDLQRYFVRKIDKAPYFEEPEFIENDNYLGCEFELYSDADLLKCESATLCYLNLGIILSPGLSIFQQSFIPGRVQEIEDSFDYTVRCIHNEESLEDHIDYIRESAGLVITKSYDLWAYKEQFFSTLEFCPRVEDQLQAIDQFRVIHDRLKQLDNYSKEWTTGPFNPELIPSKVTGEGQTVRNGRKEIASRTFECPDGEERTFLWHLRATPGAIRIYFYPIEDEQKIIVGHIGEKLYYNN